MKTKTLFSLMALCAGICSCKKNDLSQPLPQQAIVSNVTWNAIIYNYDDTVRFTHWWDKTDWLEDGHTGRIVSFDNTFFVPCDTCAYAKTFFFSLFHSADAKLDKAELSVDGNRKALQIDRTSKTQIFTYTTPLHLTPNNLNPLFHGMGIRMKEPKGVRSAKGEWYQWRLDSAIILHVYPRPQARMITVNLPEWGPRMIYE
jgi:hypothetical protein